VSGSEGSAPLRSADAHPGDLLSALLDGELPGPEEAAVVAHLAGCDRCNRELDAVAAARDAVRALPVVAPPPGFLEACIERGRADEAVAGAPSAEVSSATVTSLEPRRRRQALGGVAASVAAVLVVLVAGTFEGGPVRPEVGRVVGDHAATVLALAGDGLVNIQVPPSTRTSSVTPSTAPYQDPEGLPAPHLVATELDGGYQLVRGFRGDQGVHLVYQSDSHVLSVFELPGRCDFDGLPAGGRRLDVGGAVGWHAEAPDVGGHVVVVERGGLVAVLVGDGPSEEVLGAAASLPAPRQPSSVQRVRQAVASGLRQLSPVG
jgi:hypothetical protein